MKNTLPDFLSVLSKVQLQAQYICATHKLRTVLENSSPCCFSSFTLPLVPDIHFYCSSSVVPLQTLRCRTGLKFAQKQGDILLLTSIKNFCPLSKADKEGLGPCPHRKAHVLTSVFSGAFSVINFKVIQNRLKKLGAQKCRRQQKLSDYQQNSRTHSSRYWISCALKKNTKISCLKCLWRQNQQKKPESKMCLIINKSSKKQTLLA